MCVPLSQTAFLEAEKRWTAFGDAHGVRVVIFRVADRVLSNTHSSCHDVNPVLPQHVRQPGENPCRVEECGSLHEPITRIHSEDLSNVLLRMLSMFDIVDTHGADSYMKGSASMSTSIKRFPSGTVLEVVDDATAESVADAELFCNMMLGNMPTKDTCDCDGEAAKASVKSKPAAATAAYRTGTGRNADLKSKLGMPELKYKDYRQAAAKMYGHGLQSFYK